MTTVDALNNVTRACHVFKGSFEDHVALQVSLKKIRDDLGIKDAQEGKK